MTSTISHSCIEDVNQKRIIWLHYYCTMLSLKHDFHVVDKSVKERSNGWGKADKECLGIAFYWLWKNKRILDFDAFSSDKNFKVIDHGDSWEENGFAERFQLETFGIYNWYSKHKYEIRLA